MSLTPETTVWNPNRYKGTEYVISYAADGAPSLTKKTADYTGVNYQFAALPTGKATTGTTTTGTTTTGTTQSQTTEAFGDVKPWWWNQQGDGQDSANTFRWNKKAEDPYAFEHRRASAAGTFESEKAEDPYAFEHRRASAAGTFESEQEQPGFFKKAKKTISGFVPRPVKEKVKEKWEKFKPLAVKAIDYVSDIYRPGANKSFRGVAGLYNTEINLMRKYGSVRATEMNPTGDTRKDDAGFNIVSRAGNYNEIGTYSRRHNMLKEADNIINPAEKRKARDKIRADWKKEKETGVENTDYGINSSGSTPDTSSYGGHGSAEAASQAAESGGRDYSESPGAMAGDMEYGEE